MNHLESVWRSGGAIALRRSFNAVARRDTERAASLLSDPELPFPVVYILFADINALALKHSLPTRCAEAINLIEGKGTSEISTDTLRWAIETGAGWNGPNNEYDVYDGAIDRAAMLFSENIDSSTAGLLVELTFRRNRQRLFIHDLVWSIFRFYNPAVPVKIAEYLLTKNERDFKLACKLLHLGKAAFSPAEQRRLYDAFHKQFYENRPYLYVTGEHFNMTSEPEYIKADPEAKYLQHPISPDTTVPLEPLTESESKCLEDFRRLPVDKREKLAAFSHRLAMHDSNKWQQWIDMPMAAQVMAADAEYEVV